MKIYLKELENKIDLIFKKKKLIKKKTAFFISNTAKLKNIPFYLTPLRETKNFYYFGVTLFNDNVAKRICKVIDGRFDTIFVDTEKKSLNLKKENYLTNLERTAKENIKKSYLKFYKANDLTVNAAENFLQTQFKNEIRNLGGKRILIIGAGNIGFKLALRLVERGANLEIYRRNQAKLKKICDLINFIKPAGNKSRIKPFNILKNKINNFEVIICCAKGTNIIKLKNIGKLKKDVIFLDVGKGMFEKNALNNLIKNNYKVYRLDVSTSLDMEVENSEIFKSIERKKYNTRKINGFTLINNGLLGRKSDIIVDDIRNPKIIYGICDGEGDFINLTKKNFIKKKIIKAFKHKVKFV